MPLFRCLQVFLMSCPSARKSLIRVATLVDLVSLVSADKLRAFPLFNAASIFDFVVCFIVLIFSFVFDQALENS